MAGYCADGNELSGSVVAEELLWYRSSVLFWSVKNLAEPVDGPSLCMCCVNGRVFLFGPSMDAAELATRSYRPS